MTEYKIVATMVENISADNGEEALNTFYELINGFTVSIDDFKRVGITRIQEEEPDD